MADARRVQFVETRQIRRNHKTVQWKAGETYPYDPDMDPMIKIGHANFVDDDEEGEVAPSAGQANDPGETGLAEKPRQVPDPAKAPPRKSK